MGGRPHYIYGYRWASVPDHDEKVSELLNLHEYIIGTHPKKNNTDLMIIGNDVYNDKVDDGAEIFAGGTSSSHSKGGVIYRTDFKNGSLSFGSYVSGYVIYDGDGCGSNYTNWKYQISRKVVNPSSEMECCDEDKLYYLFELKDGSGVFRNLNGTALYIWNKKSTIPDSTSNENGNKYCSGEVVILNRTDIDVTFDYNPLDRNREIYFSNPFEIDTDSDGIVDGDEIRMFEDSDLDRKSGPFLCMVVLSMQSLVL